MYYDHIERFYEGVIPAYEEYVEESKKNEVTSKLRRSAISTAHELYHFREQLIPHVPEGTLDKSKEIGNALFEYHLIADIFNSTKHNPTKAPGELLKNANSVITTIVSTIFPFTSGMVMHNDVRIIATTLIGEKYDLLEVYTKVMNYWLKFMVDKNFIESAKSYKYTGNDIITSEQKNYYHSLSLMESPELHFNLLYWLGDTTTKQIPLMLYPSQILNRFLVCSVQKKSEL